ncbi:MAG: hypothetical protein JJLCMIEE_02699 [Acidimicrobiales bacterium]|nr:MAG: thioredoxin domain-containing protein [Actinomycetota bacterium]MBV6509605.1 hypothetical protein [Acidimicrobiales bacterium]RIK06534.1 MAG: thioredoxin domain-containing protein [Acidobacteriota bacterium]
MNRLAGESSPYLLQHAANPVDWYPWGEEAFTEAKRRDLPILLSIGYSSCHWCHVMAHESFEDPATAEMMNEHFVNVKVDREERPDIDAVYMDATQAMTGQGGWPMTVFMTPQGEPFHCGTYYPDERRGQLPSFRELLDAVIEAWQDKRADLIEQATALTQALERASVFAPGDQLPGQEVLAGAYRDLRAQHDPEWGGFGGAPKFPQAMHLEFLLRAHHHNRAENTLEVITRTLDAMASGGIYDQLGGGFSRYSVDRHWLVPHFEKMLYDNALLTRVYLHAWQVTGEQRFKQIVDETIGYVIGDLRHPQGGFCSSEDADSEGVEGRFYTWAKSEIEGILGSDAAAAIEWYGVTDEGNFEGTNILHRPVRGDLLRPPEIDEARRRLLQARDRRPRPGLDDKVLTEWNALMLASLAEAAAATGNDAWLDEAVAGAELLLAELRRRDGRWLRSWQPGSADALPQVGQPAFAADYAALLDAFTRLYEATGRVRWLDEATAVANAMLDLFWDDSTGGLFTTGVDAEPLITRPKDILDNALPSANANAALALLRLAALTGETGWRTRAEAVLAVVAVPLESHPTAFAHMLGAVDLLVSGPTEIVVAGDRPDLVNTVRARYLPNAVLAWGERFDSPLWDSREDGYAFVCRDFACRQPVGTREELAAQLEAG